MQEKLLYRPDEVAEKLGLARSRIYVMLKSGEIPSLRVGGKLRIPADALHRWVKAAVAAAACPSELPEVEIDASSAAPESAR
jgi:excisionase family DNA binding protein